MNKSKKITIIFGILIFAIMNANIALAATGTITTETIRVRAAASTESKIVAIGSLNEEVEILGEEGDWYKVRYKEKEGYIFKKYLKPNEEKTETPAEEQPTDEKPAEEAPAETPTEEQPEVPAEAPKKDINIGNVTNKETDAYLIPNFSSVKLFKIEKDKTVNLIKTVANWTKVEIDGKEAWIPNVVLMTEATTSEIQPEQVPEVKPEVPEQKPAEKPAEKPVEQPAEKPVEKPAAKEINQEGYISSNASANLRSGPSTSTASLGKLPRRTSITVISEENGWYKVSYNGKEGYISKSLVTLGKAPEETSSRNPEEPRQPSAPSVAAGSVVDVAKNYIGYNYVSGGASPSTGFDCSGFTKYVYGQCGITLSRTSSAQAINGTAVDKSNLQPGDLLLFHYYGSSSVGHVGIYVGDGQFIHAANAKKGVVYDTINSGYYADNYAGARRL